uniref:Si:dkeyp-72e1.7 n=1 Tax=Neogobius melanostomus TaxID=47308 RepID=A0A8C6WL08_9GOBI
MRRTVLKEAARRFPSLANATLYGCMFASGDLVHQLMAKNEQMDWKHTRNVAIVGFCFQGHFNYFWLRALEKHFPGKSVRSLFKNLSLTKVLSAVSVPYVIFLEGKEDVFEDWREKFFNTWKTGLMFWPFMQFLNFALMPPYVRTSFMACCAFVWATFLCFSRQNGDGTAGVALAFIMDPRKTLQDLKEVRKRSKLQKEDFWIHK